MVTKATSLLNNKRSYKTVTPFFNMSPPVRRGQALGVFSHAILFFSSRKGAEAQRNCQSTSRPPRILACLPAGGLCGLASLRPAPQNCGAPYSFFLFYYRRAAKELWSAQFDFPPRRTGFPSLRLGVFARLILFFILAKAQSPARPPRRMGAKELWSSRFDFPPRRTGNQLGSASHIPKLHVAKLVILYTFLE
jgi:hypothetical protein